MIYLILQSSLTLACKNICEACSAEGILVIRNDCTSGINTTYHQDDLKCQSCILSNKELPCKEIIMTSTPCTRSKNCGNLLSYKRDQEVSVKNLKNSEICTWNIDLRSSKDTTRYLEIDFSSGKIGKLIIFTYFLPSEYQPSSQWKTGELEIDESNYSKFKSKKLKNTNYIIAVYYSFNEKIEYAGVTVNWTGNNNSEVSNLGTILQIVALCLSIFFCIGCCSFLCRRIYKSTRSSARVYDRRSALQRLRNTSYNQVPESTIISENDLERLFPKQVFECGMIEVGEKVCSVCFDEIYEREIIRKLFCKHVFHAGCIDKWFIGKSNQEKCPLCKSNPFDIQVQELVERVEGLDEQREVLESDNRSAASDMRLQHGLRSEAAEFEIFERGRDLRD